MQTLSLIGHTQEVLAQMLTFVGPADTVIQHFFRSRKYLGSSDRRFIAETSYGVLRHLRACETRLRAATRDELFPEDRALLLLCAYLISNAETLTISPEELLQRLRGSRVRQDIDEILSSLTRFQPKEPNDTIERIGERYSFQSWMVERWIGQFGEERTERLCESLNEQAPLAIRVNTLRTIVEAAREQLKEEGVETELSPNLPGALTLTKRINVFSLKSFKEGVFEMQDAGSQMLPMLVDPKPTDKVLDACAGAGGKTLQFAALMKNRGEIFAADVHAHRLEELRIRAKRAAAQNIRVKHVTTLSDLHGTHTGFFDVVFVDAPCSGVGTIRRNPGMKWSVSEQMVKELSEKQQSILDQCEPLVKPKGRIVYATCSLFREENESVAEQFLQRHPGFAVAGLNPKSVPLREESPQAFEYLLPFNTNTDGFFVASMKRGD